MTRLNLLRLNTVPALDPSLLTDVSKLEKLSNAQLRELGLRETRFTEPALERLRRGLPQCQITQTPPKTP